MLPKFYQASGDKKSPACWIFARTADDDERYKAFEKEITERPFAFMGKRQKILELLKPLAPSSLDLDSNKVALVDKGLSHPALSQEFKRNFMDVVVFLCCLSRQVSDVSWNNKQLETWRKLGLDVEEELAKSKVGTGVAFDIPCW